jgi:hypothetical protein
MSYDDPMALATGASIGERLLDVLGLKGQLVSRVVIDVKGTNLVEVTVHREVTNGDLEPVLTEVSRYKLVPAEELPA